MEEECRTGGQGSCVFLSCFEVPGNCDDEVSDMALGGGYRRSAKISRPSEVRLTDQSRVLQSTSIRGKEDSAIIY